MSGKELDRTTLVTLVRRERARYVVLPERLAAPALKALAHRNPKLLRFKSHALLLLSSSQPQRGGLVSDR